MSLPICLSVYSSVCPSVCLPAPVCFSVCLPLSLYLFLPPFIIPIIHIIVITTVTNMTSPSCHQQHHRNYSRLDFLQYYITISTCSGSSRSANSDPFRGRVWSVLSGGRLLSLGRSQVPSKPCQRGTEVRHPFKVLINWGVG